MTTLDLNGAWRLSAAEDPQDLPSVVPGTVLNDLLNAGQISDPFFADQEFAACAETRKAWVYRRSFEVTREALDEEYVVLFAEGLMTLAEVRVNGHLVGTADNMHCSWEWDVKAALRPGVNQIEVRFASSLEYAEARQRETPTWSVNGVPGFQHLRQSHHTFGWDWGPALPDMGIFRPLSLRAWSGHRLEQVQVTQTHAEGRVDLAVRVVLDRVQPTPVPVSLRLTAPGGATVVLGAETRGGDLETTAVLVVIQPQLWWPAGLGAQPLYRLEVVTGEGEGCRRVLKIGLRTLTVVQRNDAWGRSFAFCANGVEFFAMGADYIPEDNLVTRVTPETTRRLLDDCVAAHFNCVRVWGGGYYPDDHFYDLCDERGLVVWQDMLFACALYEFTPAFKQSVERETVQNLRRLRHHACLGLWCGNNEMEQAIVEWSLGETPRQRADYIKMYEVFLPALAHREDPATTYWPASPSSFGGFDRPNSQDFGDMHDWSIWHGKAPFKDFRQRYPRFMSEFGLQSYPSAKTLAPSIPADQRNPFSYLMELREKHSAGVYPLLHYLQQEFRMPSGFENQVYVSQLVQAEGVRYGVEHWRRNRGRCMGAVIWQLNDCWPGISWSSIDYAGRWKVLHYAAKRFFAPLLLSVCETGSRAELHLTNDTREPFVGRLVWKLITRDGQVVKKGTKACRAPALTSSQVQSLDFADDIGVPPTTTASRQLCLSYSLQDAHGSALSSGVCLFVPSKFFELEDPGVTVKVSQDAEGYSFAVKAKRLARFVSLDFDGFDAILDDNGFDLVPGETRTIRVKEFRGAVPSDAKALTKSLRLRSLWDSWHHD